MSYITYKETIERFEAEILPYVTEQFGPDDQPAINESWNDWTDALCQNGEITDRAYDVWCYEPENRDDEDLGFAIMFDPDDDDDEIVEIDRADADDEEEAEYLVSEYADQPEYENGRVFYELA